MKELTAGQILDLLQRAEIVIASTEGADEHGDILRELRETASFISEEIGGSHMGCGRDVVLIERGGL